MAIRREQPGAAKAAAAAGTAIGAGQKAVHQQAEAAAIKRQQMQVKAREAAEQRAWQWEQQKMEITSQRAFERELRIEDYKLAAEDRAAEGAIERIEFSKDLDFQMEQKEYVRNIERKQTVVDAYEKEVKEGRVDPEKDPVAEREIWQANWDLKEAKKGNRSSTAPDLRSQELTENREERAARSDVRAEESAQRSQEAHVARLAGDAVDPFKQLQQADKVAQILSGFSENQEVDPKGFWAKTNRKHTVPLAVRDEDGEWVEATPSEAQLYRQAKTFETQQYKQINNLTKYTPNVVADPNTMPDLPSGVLKGDVRVQSPDGEIGWLSQKELSLPEYKGFRRL